MKVTSVIFLIVAIVLTFGGFFACKYARRIAPNDVAIDGETIKDGTIFNEIEYSDQNISRIALDLKDCTLTIHGNSKTSYAKLKNFEPNKYIGSVSKKTLTISNNISITDYLNLDGSGAKFAGVWRTLRSIVLGDGKADREVDLYIANEEEIKQIALTLSNVTLRLIDVSQTCDISVSASKSDIEFNGISPSSIKFEGSSSNISLLSIATPKLTFETKDGSINMRKITGEKMSFDVDKTDINMIETSFETLDLKQTEGDISISTPYSKDNFQRSIVLSNGEIKVGTLSDDEPVSVGSSDTYKNDTLSSYINIEIEKGSLTIRYGEEMIPPKTEDSTDSGSQQA